MAKVKVSYSPKTGKRLMEVVGVTGPSCENLLEKIEKVVGFAGERTRKDEYFDAKTNTQGDTNANQF